MSALTNPISADVIERRILLIRGQKVMLDFQLAALYEVQTKALNQAVKRNLERFPEDFMFRLTNQEMSQIRWSQSVTTNDDTESNSLNGKGFLRSQSVTSKPRSGSGGRRHPILAFTEQGVAMLSSVLGSPRAIQVNIAIMRTFVQLRQMLASNADLARKLAALEKKYDQQFKAVFDAIRELMEPATPQQRREMGFHTSLPAQSPKSRTLRKSSLSPRK